MSSTPIIPDEFLLGRGTNLYGYVAEATDGGAETALSLASANVTVRFRAYQDPADAAFLKNVAMTESATTGYFSGYVPAFTTAYDALWGEVVLVDAGTADAGTPTGYKELVLERRLFRVVDTATT